MDDSHSYKVWRFSYTEFGSISALKNKAINIIRSQSPSLLDIDLAEEYLKEALARKLLEAGHTLNQIELFEHVVGRYSSDIGSYAFHCGDIFKIDSYILKIEKEIRDIFPKIVSERSADLARPTRGLALIILEDFKDIIETLENNVILSAKLRNELRLAIVRRLSETGLPRHEAVKIARVTVSDFQSSVGRSVITFSDPIAADIAAQLVMSFGRAMRARPTEAFGVNAGNSPSLAVPSLRWKNRDDRLPNETPIEFLQRVWSEWLDADMLYQDRLTHFGEDRLVRAVRDFCRRKKRDPNLYLPPAKSVRNDREFAEAKPGPRRQELRKLLRRRKQQFRPQS